MVVWESSVRLDVSRGVVVVAVVAVVGNSTPLAGPGNGLYRCTILVVEHAQHGASDEWCDGIPGVVPRVRQTLFHVTKLPTQEVVAFEGTRLRDKHVHMYCESTATDTRTCRHEGDPPSF